MKDIKLALATELYNLLTEKDRLDVHLERNEAISHGAYDRVVNDARAITLQLEGI